MEEHRGGGAVEKSGTHLPRRAPTDVEGAGGHDRSRKAAPPRYLVPDHQPARPRLSRAANPERSGPGEHTRSGEALRLEDVGRAELQAGQARIGMERLPGKERPGDPPPLATGVLRVQLLLVGIWAPSSFARRAY